MKIHLIKHFFLEFKKRKKKTALITFAIAWGTLSLLLMMSFGRGLSTQSKKGLLGLGKDLIIISGGQTSKVYNGLPKGRRILLYPNDIDILEEQIPEIKHISPESYTRMTLSYKGNETSKVVNGVYSSLGIMRSQVAQLGGRFINFDDNRLSRRVVFLGWNLATELFGRSNPIGKTVYIKRVPFKVIGIMKEKLQTSNYNSMDYDIAYIPFTTFSQIYSQRYLDRIHIQPVDTKYSLYIEERVRKILGKKYRFHYDDEYGLNVWNTIKQAKIESKIFIGIEIFLGLIGALTLLIAAVGVTNLMYAIVKERTREIGIKMSMGAKRRHIIFQFMIEAFLIFIKGTFWGAIISFNIVSLVRLIPVSFVDSGIQAFLCRPVFSLDILILFITIMGILVFLSGIFPAMRASKLSPVEALRYE